MFEVSVEETFSAGHALRGYKGKCENPHGHNYRVRVNVEGEQLDSIGLLFVFAHLKKILPTRIHYVSCDPATLGRDLAQLVGTNGAGPYTIESINLFDIFPQTYHMEVLVRLRRSA